MMENTKELEHVEELVSLADALKAHADNAVKLTQRMAKAGIFTNALEDSYVGAVTAAQVVGEIADAHLLSKAREVSATSVK